MTKTVVVNKNKEAIDNYVNFVLKRIGKKAVLQIKKSKLKKEKFLLVRISSVLYLGTMKTIYLYVSGEGMKEFDYNSESIKAELEKRNIIIGDEASIGNRAKVKTLFITGSKHAVNWYGTEMLHIGCHKKEISWWKENYKDIGKKEGYTNTEIEEYGNYIMICENLYKAD